jgi:hypothetical protein
MNPSYPAHNLVTILTELSWLPSRERVGINTRAAFMEGKKRIEAVIK